jgi:transcriptional regulator with XRE-family HTH domain
MPATRSIPQNRVRELRKARGLKPHDLAAKLRVDTSTITRWESGRGAIPDHRKIQLANLFDVSVAYVMGWSKERKAA